MEEARKFPIERYSAVEARTRDSRPALHLPDKMFRSPVLRLEVRLAIRQDPDHG